MTQRRSTALAVTCTLAVCASFVAFPAAVSRADADTIPAASSQTASAESHDSLTLVLSSAPASAPSKQAKRHYHRRSQAASPSTRRSLPSRGLTDRIAGATSVVGRLAVVTTDNAPIRAGRERYGRLLSSCPKGQYLAISGETATEYAVLMIDHSIGYIAKSDAQLLDYQVVSNSGTSLGQRLRDTAFEYLGVPYLWGGDTKSGIDCSGFVKAVYEANGLRLPRVSGDQAGVGYEVPLGDPSQWLPGDRLYFACHHPRVDHTGMYIGDGRFIHASVGHNHQVAIDSILTNDYYAKHLVAVRRSKEIEDEYLASGGTPQPAAQTAAAVDDSTGDAEASQER